ncbi:MAG: excinuclease ABC subunit UvrB [Prevotellaceae bacterium]|nr:excinuclease ABC subunit UvrB [Candidatus Colivivens equi]MCQ2076060.1 excinuclease ABC subunit UvrB [Bacteroidaceae bacterium]
MSFDLTSAYKPTGDQPEAIEQLTAGVREGLPAQVLLGVTGSGKTFTIANVINNIGRPTLILSHNKTLAHQLYTEMKHFFPNNAVEYYVSYYDYYQPEAYLPATDTYIEKDLAINEEVDRLRLSAVSALLSGRKDVIVVSSVSCIYGMGSPMDFSNNVISISVGSKMDINALLRKLVDCLYVRNDIELERGKFRVLGETIDIYLAYDEKVLRVCYAWDEIESIKEVDPVTQHVICDFNDYKIYPANIFMTSKSRIDEAVTQIENDLQERILYYDDLGDTAKRNLIKTRVSNDLEMIKELGHCSGIENYSRYFDGRKAGERPYCLLDFFPENFLLVVDESHESIPQIRAMYGGDRKRKQTLVEYAYRLPAALDNRPLTFDEFEELTPQTIYVSATPANYELEKSEGIIVEQLIRPTGLLDPQIVVRPTANQVDDLLEEIQQRVEKDERVIVTTLTKRMAEEMAEYLLNVGVRCTYIHSDIDTFERVDILDKLRRGEFDVIVGVNLLREGLDLPEVSLVAILDADKEGFLRSHRALTQTIGRAARNVNGMAILYGDHITESMQKTIEETQRRRKKQMEYNQIHGITPTQIRRAQTAIASKQTIDYAQGAYYDEVADIAAESDPIVAVMNEDQIRNAIERSRMLMRQAAEKMDFILAAQYRDEMLKYAEML